MRTGNNFQSRKARSDRDLERKIKLRKSKDRVLIVCEGKNTEPNYLKELRGSLDLSRANIEIYGEECGSAPINIVDYALKRFEEDRGYDRVYCVFDKDQHTTYQAAVDKISRKPMPKGTELIAIKSIPCFEYWVLLHFKQTTTPFCTAGGRSPCDMVGEEVKKLERRYQKGMKGLYKLIGDKTFTAIANAEFTLEQAEETGTVNPSTEMHLLVKYLRELSDQ